MRTISVISTALLCMCLGQTIARASDIQFGQPIPESGGTPVNPGDVYGTAEFELKSAAGLQTEDALSALMNALIESRFGNNDGSYLLTLELLRNGKSIVQRPIISVTYSNKRFLFINWSTKVSRGATFKGKLIDTEAIDSTNNDVEVALRSYYKANATFDLSIFDVLDQINKNFNVIEKLDAAGLSSSVLGSVRDTLSKALQRADESQDLFKYSMAFAQLAGVSDRTRILTVPVRFQTDNGSAALKLKIKTWSVSSKFLFDAQKGQFVHPLSSVYINNTSVAAQGTNIPIFEFLRKNGSDSIKSFINDVMTKGYSGADIYSRCSELLTSYRKYLSNRDALALLWATINEYRFNFKKSHGAVCVEGRKAEFEGLGLPTESLIAFLKS